MHHKKNTPRQSINKAYLRVKPTRTQIERFKSNLIELLEHTNDRETTMDFLCEALRKGIYSLQDCNDFIQKVRSKGGKLPVNRMQDYTCVQKTFTSSTSA